MPQYSDLPAGATVLRSPDVETESYSDLPPGAKVVRAPGGPKPSAAAFAEADLTQSPLRRFGGAVWDTMGAPILHLGKSAIGSVMDLSKDAFDARQGNFTFPRTVQNAKSAVNQLASMGGVNAEAAQKAWDSGDYLGAAKAMVHNPMLESIGEKTGEGDIAGAAGTGVGVLGNAALMSGVADPAINAATSKIKDYGISKARKYITEVDKPNAWFSKLPVEVQNKAKDFILQNGLNPTEAGRLAASEKVQGLQDTADSLVMKNPAVAGERVPVSELDDAASLKSGMQPNYDKAGQTATRKGFEDVQKNYERMKFEAADPAEILAQKQKLADKVNAKNLQEHAAYEESGWQHPKPRMLSANDITDSQVKAVWSPETLTRQDLIEMKRAYRKELSTPNGNLAVANDAVASYQNHLAAKANEIVQQGIPELQQIGLQTRDAINARRIIDDAAGRLAKNVAGGISGAAAAPVAGAVAVVKGVVKGAQAGATTWGLAKIFKDPIVKSQLASMIYRASNGTQGLATATARLGAISAMLDNQVDMENRQADAINAKE